MNDYLDKILAVFQWIWGFWQVKFILGHIALNTVVAIAASISTNEFQLKKLAEFLYRKALPNILVFAAFAAFGEVTKQGAMTNIAFLALETSLVADLAGSLKLMGLKLPDWSANA